MTFNNTEKIFLRPKNIPGNLMKKVLLTVFQITLLTVYNYKIK